MAKFPDFSVLVVTFTSELHFRFRKDRWTHNWIPHTFKPTNIEFLPKIIFPYFYTRFETHKENAGVTILPTLLRFRPRNHPPQTNKRRYLRFMSSSDSRVTLAPWWCFHWTFTIITSLWRNFFVFFSRIISGSSTHLLPLSTRIYVRGMTLSSSAKHFRK